MIYLNKRWMMSLICILWLWPWDVQCCWLNWANLKLYGFFIILQLLKRYARSRKIWLGGHRYKFSVSFWLIISCEVGTGQSLSQHICFMLYDAKRRIHFIVWIFSWAISNLWPLTQQITDDINYYSYKYQ